MTFDQALDALAFSEAPPVAAIEWILANWDEAGPLCRKLLADFNAGDDPSDRTARALFAVLHVFGEKRDTAAFEGICFILDDYETADLVLGDAAESIAAPLLISTFNGRTSLLRRVIDAAEADESVRGDALMAMCYLTRTGKVAEAETYAVLAALPDRLDVGAAVLWVSWASAVAAMGFTGLAGAVEAAFRQGRIAPSVMTVEQFWQDVRESQADPHAMASPGWTGIGPLTDAIGAMMQPDYDGDDAPSPPVAEPLRNPLRDVGRNDPCPCGSGRKFKKCCGAGG